MLTHRLGIGLLAGLAVAAVDRWALGGEISPIAIVGLLLLAGFSFGAAFGWPGWSAALALWVPLPAAHLLAYQLGLPDTMHPNTLESIGRLAAFALAVVSVGLAGGAVLRLATAGAANDRSRPESEVR